MRIALRQQFAEVKRQVDVLEATIEAGNSLTSDEKNLLKDRWIRYDEILALILKEEAKEKELEEEAKWKAKQLEEIRGHLGLNFPHVSRPSGLGGRIFCF